MAQLPTKILVANNLHQSELRKIRLVFCVHAHFTTAIESSLCLRWSKRKSKESIEGIPVFVPFKYKLGFQPQELSVKEPCVPLSAVTCISSGQSQPAAGFAMDTVLVGGKSLIRKTIHIKQNSAKFQSTMDSYAKIKQLTHSNLQALDSIAVNPIDGFIHVFLQNAETNLHDLLQKVALPLALQLKIAIDVLSGVWHLHRCNVPVMRLNPDFINVHSSFF